MIAEAKTIAGVELVTIPASEYADLLQCRRQLAELNARQRAFETASKSWIERDAEVAVFLADRLGQKPVYVIRAECLAHFGADRTPSKSALDRYWHRLRRRAPG